MCFLPNNYTIYGNVTQIQETPSSKREVTLAVVALISVLVGALVASIIQVQMKTYNDMVNDKLGDLESRFTLELNQVEDQVTELQTQHLELTNAIATLSRVNANLANRQQRFENFMFSFDRQLLEPQIITTRRSIENRKLIMSQNARETQRSIIEYSSRKLILQALKTLKNIPSLRNNTFYRNQIAEGVIHNTEIYRLIQQGHKNFTNWVKKHPLIARNQSHRLREFDNLQKAYKQQIDQSHDIKLLEKLAAITLRPIKFIEFTNNFDPISFPGVDVGQGISGLIKDMSRAGLEILDRGSQLVENIVDKGINVLSEPIRIVIITASIIGGIILLLIAYKYFLAKEGENAKVNTDINLQIHPHIWKEYDKYH